MSFAWGSPTTPSSTTTASNHASASSSPFGASSAAGSPARPIDGATPLQLSQAIEMMYAGNMKAKDWLLQLMKSPLSWSLPAQVLQSPTAPSPDVGFYCANILSTKVRENWGSLAPAIQDKTMHFLWTCLLREPQFPSLVHQRITITLARAVLQSRSSIASPAAAGAGSGTSSASVSSPSAVGGCLDRCLKLAKSDPARHCLTTLAVLVALPSELQTVPITARQREALEKELAAYHKSVAAFILFVLQAATSAHNDKMLVATFVAAKAWVPHGLHLLHLVTSHKALLQASFSMLADVGASQRSATVCVAAVDFLERAFQLDSRGSLYDTPMPPARLAGMIGGLISGINNTKDRFGSACRAGPENEAEGSVAQALTRLSSVALEAFPQFVCQGQHPGCLPLVQYILLQTSNPVRGTASLTLDAWSCVQDVPMAERCPALREPVLQRLFDIVLQQCTLPAQSGPQRSPTEGSDYAEECDDNDDDDLIGAFRVGPPGCMDLLGSLINTIPAYTIQKIAHVFSTGCVGPGGGAAEKSSWMNREAALFVFYKVSSECPPAAAEHTLKAVFKAIRAQPALLMTRAAPRLTATTCRVIGNYARDVLRNPANASALEFAIRYFLYVLEHSKGSVVPVVAARALAKTCQACKRSMSSQKRILELVATIDKAAEAGIATEARVELAKAISALVTTYAARIMDTDIKSSLHVAEVIGKCASQNCIRLQRFMAEAGKLNADKASPMRQRSTSGVAAELECLTSLLRWFQFPAAGKDGVVHPLQHVLSKLWPVLEALPAHFLDARVVMRELCELYRAVFLALQTATIRILPKMLTNMNDIYCTHGLSSCLNTFKVAFEKFGNMGEVQQLFHGLIKRVCEVTFSWVSSKASKFTDDPELVETFFETMHSALVFCPGPILLNPVLPNVFKLAVLVSDTDDAKSARASLRFFSLLLDRRGRTKYQGASSAAPASLPEEAHKRITECVKLHGEHLVQVLLQGIAGRCNEIAWRWLANVLWFLTTEYPAPMVKWLQAGLCSPVFASVPGFTPEVKVAVMAAIKSYVAENSTRAQRLMRMLVKDMCKFCRREADVGDVLAHPVPAS